MAPGLHIHETGEGPPLLLLHAFPLDASQWDHQVAALADRWRCLRPDAFGCGSSGPPSDGPSIDAWADRLLEALDRRGVGTFACCGLSMGGYLAFALLRRAPDRLSALILASTRATPDSDEVRRRRRELGARVRAEGIEPLVDTMMDGLLSPLGRQEAHVVEPVRARIRRCTPEGVLWLLEVLATRPDSTPQLGAIGVPTLVIAGGDDALSPSAEMRHLSAAIPNARFTQIDRAGHLSNLEWPARFSALVGEFLEEA